MLEYAAAGREKWPELGLDDAAFVNGLAQREVDGGLPPLAHAADLWLALACARGLEAAIAEFHRQYLPVIQRVLAHRQASGDVADDALQVVRQRLLVGDPSHGADPKIADYRAAGPLRSWVASAAANTLLMLRRAAGRRREVPENSSQGAADVCVDPELEYLKRRYAVEVEAALVAAFGRLSDRQQTLLRLHLNQGMSIDTLGGLYGVGRSTAARWLADARSALGAQAREQLKGRLSLDESECDSLIALVRSRLDLSVIRRPAS